MTRAERTVSLLAPRRDMHCPGEHTTNVCHRLILTDTYDMIR